MKTPEQNFDARSPWAVSIHDLARRPGEMKTLELTLAAPADMGLQTMRVPEGDPIDLDLRLESVTEGVLVSGQAHVDLVGECSRCLIPISGSEDYEVQELYFFPGHEEDEEDPVVVDDLINLEPAVRDAIVLELPFMPLCREDCRGLCLICGADLNEDPDHDHGDQTDARWDKLKGLLGDADDEADELDDSEEELEEEPGN